MSPPDLWYELMQFYVREAWLLDDRKFRDWLELERGPQPRATPEAAADIARASTPGGRVAARYAAARKPEPRRRRPAA